MTTLLRPDATFIDDATNRAERIFPIGSDWKYFRSRLPEATVFANTVLDPAVGMVGEIATQTFAAADWHNWISATKISLFELSTRVGLPAIEDSSFTQGLSTVYRQLGDTISLVAQLGDNPGELVSELGKNAALQVLQVLSGHTSMINQTVAQVIAAAVWAVDVVRAKIESDLGKNVTFPPLQSDDPATDTWQVNRVLEVFRSRGNGGIVYPDGKIEAASNADYTSLFLPAYMSRQKWQYQHRAKGLAAQQGPARRARGPSGEAQYNFDAGDASTFGFMPGTSTTLRVLQASYRFYFTTRGTPVDRYTLRCKGVDKPCYKSTKSFDGSKDCRQCVEAESVWPVEGIGWAYGGAPLNVTTPGENVGAFYPSTNKLLMNLLDMIAQPGPLLYTVDATRMNGQWQESFERFWEFAHREWAHYTGYGWRGLISRLATMMTAFEDPEGELQPGGRDPDMPLDLIASARERSFSVPFSASIYSRLIMPYCADLLRLQRAQLQSVTVAYIPPGAGALYTSTGKIRRTNLGDRFETARRELLSSSKRMLIDLRQVSDPEYRSALRDAGVKASPVNPKLHGSPGVGDGTELQAPKLRPPRSMPPPRVSRVPALAGVIKLPLLTSQQGSGRTVSFVPRKPLGSGDARVSPTTVAAGLSATAATLTAAALYGLHKNDVDVD